jgi:hypothetical protein
LEREPGGFAVKLSLGDSFPIASAKQSNFPMKALFFPENGFVSLKKPLLQVVYFEQYIKTDQLINHPPSIVRVSSSISPQRGSMLVAFPIPKKCLYPKNVWHGSREGSEGFYPQISPIMFWATSSASSANPQLRALRRLRACRP